MNYSEATERLAAFRTQITAIRSEMRKVQAAIEPEAPPEARPVYDAAGLVLAIQAATSALTISINSPCWGTTIA